LCNIFASVPFNYANMYYNEVAHEIAKLAFDFVDGQVFSMSNWLIE